ncbi:hypothetical protein [Haliangium sp.]|uniref:hypothetical protein n=1 Tax=Haliangium sp. TaxID=2663208 RepID=UPI003D13583F
MSAAATVAALGGFESRGEASPYSEVASALDRGDRFDLHLTLDYGFEAHRASVRREQAGLPGTGPDDPIPEVKDLYFAGSRHLLTPRAELGVFTDLAITVALPLVLSDSRSLDFDQRGGSCVFPGGGAAPTCINRDNSTTVQDGILPATGFNADDPGGPGFVDGATIFRGPGRAGLDQIHLGLVWAAMNQDRDDTKPTWKIGVETRLAIGTPMRLDVVNPGSSTGVSRGLHEVRVWTSFARRIGRTEPYVDIWWQAPFAQTDDAAFQDLGFGQERSSARQRGGIHFGVDTLVWERPAQGWQLSRVSVDAAADLEAYFEGREYSEMWEVFQYAGTPRGDPAATPLVLDADPTQDGRQDLVHPGVTAGENYLRTGGRLGAHGLIGPLQLGASFGLVYTQPHVISFADAGEDLPTCGPNVSGPCENEDNALVNPGTAEVNPGHVSLIDFVGRRYRVDEVVDYVVRIEARVLF